jgi:hypothetical protein
MRPHSLCRPSRRELVGNGASRSLIKLLPAPIPRSGQHSQDSTRQERARCVDMQDDMAGADHTSKQAQAGIVRAQRGGMMPK